MGQDMKTKTSKIQEFCRAMPENVVRGPVDSGIYVIFNKVTFQAYIGRTANINKRWQQHRMQLSMGKHHNRRLQESWNKYGEANFNFTVFMLIGLEDLSELEKELIEEDMEFGCYNFPTYVSNQGRKSLDGKGESPVIRLRVTPELYEKVKRNGAQWARDALENAK